MALDGEGPRPVTFTKGQLVFLPKSIKGYRVWEYIRCGPRKGDERLHWWLVNPRGGQWAPYRGPPEQYWSDHEPIPLTLEQEVVWRLTGKEPDG